MIDFKTLVETATIDEILGNYPVVQDFLANYNIENIPRTSTIISALEHIEEDHLVEFGYSRSDIIDQFTLFLETALDNSIARYNIRSITILGGYNKMGLCEDVDLTINTGDIISIVGPTGAGKSRLLSDIECLAQRDTPTGRQILVNGKALDDEERSDMEGRLVAQLSQNMNFVMDLSVKDFLEMHAKSRLCEKPEEVIARCFEYANDLAGEKFDLNTKVTQLSGGQSRALMIADTAYMSASPIVLIDEIENAGIDRKRAIEVLSRNEKIVFISTHDPLLALNADKRIVVRNGGINRVIETSAREKECLSRIEEIDKILLTVRDQLRLGKEIDLNMMGEGNEDKYIKLGAV